MAPRSKSSKRTKVADRLRVADEVAVVLAGWIADLRAELRDQNRAVLEAIDDVCTKLDRACARSLERMARFEEALQRINDSAPNSLHQ